MHACLGCIRNLGLGSRRRAASRIHPPQREVEDGGEADPGEIRQELVWRVTSQKQHQNIAS